MADSEGSYGRRKQEEQPKLEIDQGLANWFKQFSSNQPSNASTPGNAAVVNPNATPGNYQIGMEYEGRSEGEESQPQNEPWNQIVQPEPQSEPTYNEPETGIDTGRLGPKLTPVTPSPVVEEQTAGSTSDKEEQTYSDVQRPKPQNPVTEKNEEAPPSPSNTYQEWMNYLAQQEAAQQADNTQNGQFTPQQDVSVLGNGYVRPLNQQHFLGAGPAEPGTMNYPTATGPVLPGWDNYGLGQVPRDYQTPYEYNPDLTVESLAGHNYQTPYEYNPDLEDLIQEDYDTQVRIQMDRGYPRDIAERIAAGTYTPDDQLADMYGGTLPQYNPQRGLFEDPQWLQDLTGGNSLAGVAANALDSILRLGSGGPVQPVTEDPLAPAGDWLLGQLIGEENVAPAVTLGNSIAQNPAVREIGDYMLDQQLGKANADELRSRFGIETTPSTIMNQPTPANYDRNGTPGNQRYVPQTGSTTGGTTGSTTQPTTTAPQTTGSGSSGKNFAEGLSDWISGLFGGNNTDGSNGTPRPGADAYLNNTQGGTTTPQGGSTSGTTPATTQPATGNQTGGTTAPQTTGSQGGNTSPYDNPNRYNPDSSAYYSRKFDDLMEDNRDLGGTLNGESIRKLLDNPINVNNSFKDIIATDFAYDTRDPLSQSTDISSDQYKKELNAFLDANPTIKSMLENKEISVQDIINTYLKNPGAPASGSGSGNGSSKPDGSKTYQPSYEQGGQVVKAPYKKGGYSEDELKNMGNKPYKDYRGNTAYEGYYYWNGRWYPVDQDKANYYNYYGTYNGYNDDMKQYYNTFGTYYGYRPGWRTAGRSGGGRRYGGGGGRGGSGYSGGGSGSGSTSSANNEIRVNNIMKNWSF